MDNSKCLICRFKDYDCRGAMFHPDLDDCPLFEMKEIKTDEFVYTEPD